MLKPKMVVVRWATLLAAVGGVLTLASPAMAGTCSPATGRYASAVLADAPVAFYQLNESGGPTLCDASTQGNNGLYSDTNAVSYGLPGPLQTSTATAVGDDGVQLATSNGDSPITGNHSFTYEAWYRYTDTAESYQDTALVDMGTATGEGDVTGLAVWGDHCSGTGPSYIALDEYDTNNCWPTSAAGVNLYDGDWHYLAITYDAGTDGVIAYVDGYDLGPQIASTAFDMSTSPIRLGWWVDTSVDQYLVGDLADVAVYPTALSAAEIDAHYAAAFPVATETTAPTVTGNRIEGDKLTVTNGSWSNSPTSYTYQWEDCTSSAATSCTPVASNGTQSSYVLTTSDAGDYVTATVTANNQGGASTPATGTPAVGPVVPPAPTNTTRPFLRGPATAGSSETCERGIWTPKAAFTYAWNLDGSAVAGATGPTFTPSSHDVGETLTCTVTATNPGGTASETTKGVKIKAGRVPVTLGKPTVTGFTLAVPLTCASSSSCTVSVNLTVVETLKGGKVVGITAVVMHKRAKTKKKTVIIGHKTLTIKAGAVKDVKVSLNSKGRKLLKKHHKLTAKLGASSGGKTTSKTVHFKA